MKRVATVLWGTGTGRTGPLRPDMWDQAPALAHGPGWRGSAGTAAADHADGTRAFLGQCPHPPSTSVLPVICNSDDILATSDADLLNYGARW